MRKNLLAALVILTLGASQVFAQNAVKNPSFEDPTVDTGSSLGQWFRFASGTGSSTESIAMPNLGTRHIDLEVIGANQFAGVFQRLESLVNPGNPRTVNPGASLTFSGFHKLNSLGGGVNPPTSEIKIEWTGAPQNRLDVIALPGAYGPFTHTGIAPAGTTGATVTYAISTFGAVQGDSQVFIDDFLVTLVPIPEPATAGLLGLSALGLIGVARRRRK